MSMRGLVVALLCGVLGLGIGAAVAYAAPPRPSYGGSAEPIPAVSPSVPLARTSPSPYAHDSRFTTLTPDLTLPIVHTMHNHLATWTYHVPQGWRAYDSTTNQPLTPRQIANAQQIKYQPPGAPILGAYSLYVRVLDNTQFDSSMTVAAKKAGFAEATGVSDYSILYQDSSTVKFQYRDVPTNLHRYNFFEWFSVSGDGYPTLQVSVAGRKRDVPGLNALLQRFADNVTGTDTPHPPPAPPSSPSSSSGAPSSGSTATP